ncbi:transposase [Bradyrhizobium sp. 146]|nr:transposase [Bradyrhizobium sp. 146]
MALHRTGNAHRERLIGSFNRRMRDDLLNESLFFDLNEVRAWQS